MISEKHLIVGYVPPYSPWEAGAHKNTRQNSGLVQIVLEGLHEKMQDLFREDPGNNVLVNCGILQGSILEPLRFLIHVNDLNIVLNPTRTVLCCCKLYHNEASFQPVDDDDLVAFADDTTLGCCERDKTVLISELRAVLEETYLWMDYSHLVINVDKSCTLFFATSQVSIWMYVVSKIKRIDQLTREAF